MREAEFLNQLYALLEASVAGLDTQQKLQLIREICDENLRDGDQGKSLTCRIVPFITGRRPRMRQPIRVWDQVITQV